MTRLPPTTAAVRPVLPAAVKAAVAVAAAAVTDSPVVKLTATADVLVPPELANEMLPATPSPAAMGVRVRLAAWVAPAPVVTSAGTVWATVLSVYVTTAGPALTIVGAAKTVAAPPDTEELVAVGVASVVASPGVVVVTGV